jgi:hypothetical protein
VPKLTTDWRQKTFTPTRSRVGEVNWLAIKLKVDGKEIPLNDFVGRFVQGVIVGGVSSLKGIKEDWQKIEVEVTK